jgi:hypothetical protein
MYIYFEELELPPQTTERSNAFSGSNSTNMTPWHARCNYEFRSFVEIELVPPSQQLLRERKAAGCWVTQQGGSRQSLGLFVCHLFGEHVVLDIGHRVRDL